MYHGQTSALLEISASIIQGSAIGPASYVVTAADLRSVTSGNTLCKYADDTYIIIPAANVHSRTAELDKVESWVHSNNLHLNRAKSVEIVFAGSKRTRNAASTPPPLPHIGPVSSLKMLGVTVSSRLSVSDHVQNVVSSCAQTLHALRLLRAHGLCDAALQTVYQGVVVARLLYAASAWGGASPRPPTGSASRAFYAAVFVPVTASRMRRPPLTWLKRWTINCSTESNMLAGTSYIHSFRGGILSRIA